MTDAAPRRPARTSTESKTLTAKILIPIVLTLLVTQAPPPFRGPVAVLFLLSVIWLFAGPVARGWRRANWLLRGAGVALVATAAGWLGGGIYHHYQVGQLASAMSKNDKVETIVEGVLYLAHVSWLTLKRDAGDAELAELAQMPGAEGATYLNLERTKVTDAGLVHLTAFPQLQRLSLRRTKITDAGMKHVAALPALESLDISGLTLSAAGVEPLRALPLQWLHCDGARIPPEALEELADAIPHLRIVRQ